MSDSFSRFRRRSVSSAPILTQNGGISAKNGDKRASVGAHGGESGRSSFAAPPSETTCAAPSVTQPVGTASKFGSKISKTVSSSIKSAFSPPTLGLEVPGRETGRDTTSRPASTTHLLSRSSSSVTPPLPNPTSSDRSSIPSLSLGSLPQPRRSTSRRIRAELLQRVGTFSTELTIPLATFTWNVNGQEPALPPRWWVSGQAGADEADGPTLVALGLQEVVVVDAASTVTYLASPEARHKRAELHGRWVDRVSAQLSPRYTLVRAESLVGMALMVFVTKEAAPRVTDVTADSRGTGPLGAGNKGAVAIRLSLDGLSIAFVNSHLAAHRPAVARRNAEQRLLARTLFDTDARTLRHSQAERLGEEGVDHTHVAIGVDDGAASSPLHRQHDLVVWFGDLNYRIDELSRDDTVDRIEAGALPKLLLHDQLLRVRCDRAAFVHYREADIRFAPSYKYDVGTLRYDTSDKQRVPSWTDRVLWRVCEAPLDTSTSLVSPRVLREDDLHPRPMCVSTTVDEYASIPCLGSDHIPVTAKLTVDYRLVDGAARAEVRASVVEALRRDRDNADNAAVPHCTSSTNLVALRSDEGGCRRTVTVTNDGEVDADLRFVPLPDATSCDPLPDWLSVTPAGMRLAPGTSAPFSFTLHPSALRRDEPNESILILHVDGGPDLFMFASVDSPDAQQPCPSTPAAAESAALPPELAALFTSPGPVAAAFASLAPTQRSVVQSFLESLAVDP